MKSTYDLIGVFWDRRVSTTDMKVAPYNPLTPEIGTPYCLFDTAGKERNVRLSALFKVQNNADWDYLRSSIADCNRIMVVDDCRPKFQGEVVQQFHERRLGQVMHLLQNEVPQAQLFITKPPVMESAA